MLRIDCKRNKNNFLKPGIVAILILELLLAQFAIANPQVHDWMHGESGCVHHHDTEKQSEDSPDSQANDNHVCFVHFIEEGISSESSSEPLAVASNVGALGIKVVLFADEAAISRHLARGPPLLFG